MRVIRNSRGIEKMKFSMAGLGSRVGKVGIPENATYTTGENVSMIAAQNEFGNPFKRIPPRPFMSKTIAEQKSNWIKQVGIGAHAIANGTTTAENVMEGIVQLAAGDVRKTISNLTSPALSPRTIAARLSARANKKHVGNLTKPLVDSGILLNSITGIVE
jgi:hypothetical protein